MFYFHGSTNTLAEISFTMDTETDLSEEGGGYAPKKAEDYPEKRKKMYHAKVSSASLISRPDPDEPCSELILIYNVGE